MVVYEYYKKGVWMKAEPGDTVKLVTKKETVAGMLMPSPDEQVVLLKLDSGYNLGFKKKEITSLTVLEKKPLSPPTKKEKTGRLQRLNQHFPIISILHTGGTIASQVDYKNRGGGVQVWPGEPFGEFPGLQQIAVFRSRLIGNMWSQDMRFSHYNRMAEEVKKELEAGAAGVIIAQGTDTIHYTAAALSFALENLSKPVLIVGAQRSSDRGSSDAFLNVVNAAYFIAHSDFGEVAVCMHDTSSDEYAAILPGTKVMKLHTSRRDAFQPINTTAWARVNYAAREIKYLRKGYTPSGNKKISLKLFNEKLKVAILKQHTNMFAEQFLSYQQYDGLVIESTGLGCLPMTKIDDSTQESEHIAKAIQILIKKGVVVVEAPQTIFGRLNLNVYEDQRRAQEMGVLGNGNDMTPATTFIKLAWLLSNYPKPKIKELITKNLRGEINERIEYQEEFNSMWR